MEAIILAGGLGTRLKSVVQDRPKPMALVKGKPFLEYLFDWLIGQQVSTAVLSVGHLHEVIVDHFGDRYRSLTLRYSVEDTPLGTGGAIKKALSLCEENDVFVVNGDTYFPISLHRLHNEHLQTNALITLAVRWVENAERYGTVAIDENHRITDFLEKESVSSGLINGGVYLINSAWYQASFQDEEKFSLETAAFPRVLASGKLYGVPFEEKFIDIGIPEDYQIANESFF